MNSVTLVQTDVKLRWMDRVPNVQELEYGRKHTLITATHKEEEYTFNWKCTPRRVGTVIIEGRVKASFVVHPFCFQVSEKERIFHFDNEE